MRLFYWGKDGGKESTSSGFWLIEFKPLFSIVLLRFDDGSRDVYHEHAFSAISWLLKGKLVELLVDGTAKTYNPSLRPIFTPRRTCHKVFSVGRSWALSFRGPWTKTWREYRKDHYVTLTNHRVEVQETIK